MKNHIYLLLLILVCLFPSQNNNDAILFYFIVVFEDGLYLEVYKHVQWLIHLVDVLCSFAIYHMHAVCGLQFVTEQILYARHFRNMREALQF